MRGPRKIDPISKVKPAAAISRARKAAFSILLAVERGHSHSDDLLRGKAVSALTAADRNLATALVLGVLRWQIRLDHQVRPLLTRPDARLDPEIMIALRMGAFQILYMDRIPARAAIDESVELAKQAGHRFASGMVNAVLRELVRPKQPAESLPQIPERPQSVLEEGSSEQHSKGAGLSSYIRAEESIGALASEGMRVSEDAFSLGLKPGIIPQPLGARLNSFPFQPKETAADLALAESHPAWMVERWVSFFGLEAARAICRHGQSQPILAIRLTSPGVEAELIAAGIQLKPGELLSSARIVASGDVTTAILEGRARLQDEGSQLVAELASTNLIKYEKSILDACAAPGGKTLILAERNPQARILACELSPPRLEQLQKRLAFLGKRVECRLADATALTADMPFDLVLADVPCSGTGTLGRNPEIRYRLRPEDLSRQAERQRAILAAALRVVRPGGCVIYSTCSLEPEENEQVVAAVLAEAPNARVVSLESRLNDLLGEGILTTSGTERLRSSLTPKGFLRLLPGTLHTDGFFIALIERFA